jgi:ribosomal protein S15P/S13E
LKVEAINNYTYIVKRKLVAFMLDHDLIKGLKDVQARDGLPQSVQVRRVLRKYLNEKGVLKEKKTTRIKRA